MLCHVFVILIFNLNEQVTRKVTTVKLTWHRQYNADKPKLLAEKIHIEQFTIEILPVFPVCIILDSGLKTHMTFEMTFLNNFYIIFPFFFFIFLWFFFFLEGMMTFNCYHFESYWLLLSLAVLQCGEFVQYIDFVFFFLILILIFLMTARNGIVNFRNKKLWSYWLFNLNVPFWKVN